MEYLIKTPTKNSTFAISFCFICQVHNIQDKLKKANIAVTDNISIYTIANRNYRTKNNNYSDAKNGVIRQG